jgi:signal transduction histidine kinase/ligand-binding sensor domain-containing protein
MRKPFATSFERRRFLIGMSFCLAAFSSLAEPATDVRELRDYRHVGWTTDNGGAGAAHSVGQTEDGFLWTGGPQGIYRFDGVRFESIDAVTQGTLIAADIYTYAISPRGGLWVMTSSKGLVRYKDDRIVVLGVTNCTPRARDSPMIETVDGDLWIATFQGLYRMHGSQCVKFSGEGTLPDTLIAGLFIDKDGTLWVKTDGDLLFLSKGATRFERNPLGAGKSSTAAFIRQGDDGGIWLSDDSGLRLVRDSANGNIASDRSLLPKGIATGKFLFARDGALWICTSTGVRHIDDPRTLLALSRSSSRPPDDLLTTAGGLTSDAVWDVFQDREGSVWVGTDSGLDRLTANSIVALALPHFRESQYALLPDESGGVWTGNWDAPLMLASNDKIVTFPQISSGVMSIRRDHAGHLWFSDGGTGQLWRRNGERFEKVDSPATPGYPARDIATDVTGALWISLINGNIYRLEDGRWQQKDEYFEKVGAGSSLISDRAGRIWVAFQDKLLLWDAGKLTKYSAEQGILKGFNTTLNSREDRLWMAGRAGVGLFSAGRFHALKTQQPDSFGNVIGAIEAQSGDLWLNSTGGGFLIPATEIEHWRHDPQYAVVFHRFSGPDGLIGTSGQRSPAPSIAEGSDGKIWFATNKGIFWTDPAHIAASHNATPPPVKVISIAFAGKTSEPLDGLKLPVGTESFEIDYAALSLVSPERVEFRYRLEGFETDWQEAGGRRQAYYTNLSPGSYRFQVIASNNSGVWNMAGTSLDFIIQPKYFQTGWFRVLCALLVAAVIAVLFRIRLQQATSKIRGRLAAQMAERERIARELHDTILQGFYGVLLRFHAAIEQIPPGETTREVLGRVLDSAENIVNEGRDSVRELRGESADTLKLGEEFRKASQNYESPGAPSLRVTTQGTPCPIHPMVYRETYRIGHQALANAYQHAAASTIIVALHYGPELFTLLVEDDGVGIDRSVLDAGGRAGHWGMRGMRERARSVGGHYTARCGATGGTVIEFKIAAKLAYEASNGASRHRWFHWKSRA